MRIPGSIRTGAPYVLAAAFLTSSVIHLTHPATFRTLIPSWLPHADAWIYVSGAAELACAAGLATRRRWAGPASVALLIAVFPGNIQMALDAGSGRNPGLADSPVLAWARLPLQIPLAWCALQARSWASPARDETEIDHGQRTVQDHDDRRRDRGVRPR
jgi:uncharacterized membrane protein